MVSPIFWFLAVLVTVDAACSPSTLSLEEGGSILYECMANVTSEVSLHWTVDDTVVHVAISKIYDSGYMALGVPDSAGLMVTSDAFIGLDGAVKTYRLTQYASSGVSESSISVGYSDASVTVSGGTTTLRIGGMEVGDLSSVNLIWAYGSGSGSFYHDGDKAGVNVNFESGAAATVAVDTVEKSLVQAHAIMAITAWGWLAPFAVVVKSIGTGVERFKEIKLFGFPVAFLAHIFLMCVAMILTIAVFALAKVEFSLDQNRVQYNHDRMAFVLLALVIAQVVLGALLRPNNCLKPDHQYFGSARALFGVCHRTVGLLTMFFGLATIMRGADNYEDLWNEDEARRYGRVAFIGFVFWIGLYVLFEACWYLYYCVINPSARAQPGEPQMDAVQPDGTSPEKIES